MPIPMLRLKTVNGDSLPVPGVEPWHVGASDPALSVMIDFRSRSSVTVAETATLDDALAHMKHTGVRCAFVVDDKKTAVVGMLTAYDIMGGETAAENAFQLARAAVVCKGKTPACRQVSGAGRLESPAAHFQAA